MRGLVRQAREDAADLTLTGLMPFFEPRHLFSAEMVAHGKPAPDLFLLASERMDTAPEHCIVIEDLQAGVTAAIAAGMRVLACRWKPLRTGL